MTVLGVAAVKPGYASPSHVATHFVLALISLLLLSQLSIRLLTPRPFLAPSIPSTPTTLPTNATRPQILIASMRHSALKTALSACASKALSTPARPSLVLAHRGAPLRVPEHTVEGYRAAAAQGASFFECDVVFTKDKHLICRHKACDLHATSDVLLHDSLAAKCRRGFTPAQGVEAADALCCAADFSLDEIRQMRGKMDGVWGGAKNVRDFVWGRGVADGPTGKLVTHRESIDLFKGFGGRFMPELKAAGVDMPFRGMTRQALATKLIAEYQEAGVDMADVWPQSDFWVDVEEWIRGASGVVPVLLDERYDVETVLSKPRKSWSGRSFEEMYAAGLRVIAPQFNLLVRAQNGRLEATEYARGARKAGLKIVTWSLERSGVVGAEMGNDRYYEGLRGLAYAEGFVYEVLDALVRKAGVVGVFSDWPETVAFYARCFAKEI